MKRITGIAFCLFAACLPAEALAQAGTNKFVDLTGTVGSSQGSAAIAYVHNRKLWKRQKFEIGIGARWTSSRL